MWPIKQIKIRGSEWFSSSCPFSLWSVCTPITTLTPAKPHLPSPYGKKLYLHLMAKADVGGKKRLDCMPSHLCLSILPYLHHPHSPSSSTPLPVSY